MQLDYYFYLKPNKTPPAVLPNKSFHNRESYEHRAVKLMVYGNWYTVRFHYLDGASQGLDENGKFIGTVLKTFSYKSHWEELVRRFNLHDETFGWERSIEKRCFLNMESAFVLTTDDDIDNAYVKVFFEEHEKLRCCYETYQSPLDTQTWDAQRSFGQCQTDYQASVASAASKELTNNGVYRIPPFGERLRKNGETTIFQGRTVVFYKGSDVVTDFEQQLATDPGFMIAHANKQFMIDRRAQHYREKNLAQTKRKLEQKAKNPSINGISFKGSIYSSGDFKVGHLMSLSPSERFALQMEALQNSEGLNSNELYHLNMDESRAHLNSQEIALRKLQCKEQLKKAQYAFDHPNGATAKEVLHYAAHAGQDYFGAMSAFAGSPAISFDSASSSDEDTITADEGAPDTAQSSSQSASKTAKKRVRRDRMHDWLSYSQYCAQKRGAIQKAIDSQKAVLKYQRAKQDAIMELQRRQLLINPAPPAQPLVAMAPPNPATGLVLQAPAWVPPVDYGQQALFGHTVAEYLQEYQ